MAVVMKDAASPSPFGFLLGNNSTKPNQTLLRNQLPLAKLTKGLLFRTRSLLCSEHNVREGGLLYGDGGYCSPGWRGEVNVWAPQCTAGSAAGLTGASPAR